MADDEDELYDKSCRDWEEVHKLFLTQPYWPEGYTSNVCAEDPPVLREFWMAHGCVQCWFDTVTNWEQHLPEYGRRGGKITVVNRGDSTEWLRRRIKNWNNPKSRQKERFQCKEHVKPLKCAVAIQFGAGGVMDAGHLAWGYELPPAWREFWPGNDHRGPWLLGEHASQQTTHQENSDGPSGWEDVFDEYKVLLAPEADFEEAFLRAGEVMGWPYLLVAYNCQSAVNYVLTGLRADGLPDGYWPAQATYYHWVTGGRHALNGKPLDPIPTPRSAPPPTAPMPRRRLRSATTPDAGRTGDAPVAARAMPEKQTESRRPARIMAAYSTADDGVIHIEQHCPALKSASAPRKLRFKASSSLAEAEAQFDGPICGTCLRMLDARTRIAVFASESAEVTLFSDRVKLDIAGGWLTDAASFELNWPEITGVSLREPMLLSSSWEVQVTYKRAGDWIPSRAEAPFASEADARACVAAILAHLPG